MFKPLWRAAFLRVGLLHLTLGLAHYSAGAELWQQLSQMPPSPAATEAWIQPEVYRAVRLNVEVLLPLLASAPGESARLAGFSEALIRLPMPDGRLAQFRFVESPVMEPGLAAQFPELRTYLGQGVDDPQATVRFDLTPAGFHAQILSSHGAVYIDPYYRGDTNLYATYYKRDYRRAIQDFQCFTPSSEQLGLAPAASGPRLVSGGNLRTYRLACAATGEYTAFHGGTLSAGMAAIVTAINRVTGVYENEVAIRLVLVASNSLVVYTNSSTDPYNNSNPSLLLSQNQSNLDVVIGSANYDIGHVFSTAGGGLAGLGVVCRSGSKAQGETGTSSPIGDAFYIDYVAHEMGHQFGANHTFNSSTAACGGGNRNGATAYEPGSGSTIMAYAGICGADDLQPHSDPYFHSVSLDEIVAYTVAGSGSTCPVVAPTGNTPPQVSAGVNYAIPKGTAFTLTASGSDPDTNSLSYCWEERDLGPSIALTTPDNGSSPLFRSFNPTASPSRTFPQFSSILNNATSLGEMLPSTTRTLQFRVVARDHQAGGGALNTADMQVTVDSNAGPFVVTSPNSAVTWSGAGVVTWDVANTTNSPINATNVNILLSTNGGLDFAFVLAADVPNTGSRIVALPAISTSAARIRVEASGNIFFDISDTNFSVVPLAPQIVLDSTTLLAENCAVPNGAIDPGEVVTINVALKNVGTADTTNLVATLLATNGVTFPSAAQAYGALLAGGGPVSLPFTFTATGSCGGTLTAVLRLQDGDNNLEAVTQVFNLGVTALAAQSLTNPAAIAIRDNTSALPYPSTISVSNIPGPVTKATVSLWGFAHGDPDDVDVLLVGPGGQNVLLMSDAGGANAVTNLNLFFDDAAAASLPNSSQISSGVYKPTNFDTSSDVFPTPAPPGPFGTTLSVFNGVDPNGTWSLYVRDDSLNATGRLAQGWSLTLTAASFSCCTEGFVTADLSLGGSAVPSPAIVDSNLTYTLWVTNLGGSTAVGVVVTDALPADLSFVSSSASQGSCGTNNGVVTCSLGSLSNGALATITLVVRPTAAGIVTNLFRASSSTVDPVELNNALSLAVTVSAFTPTNNPPILAAITNYTITEETTLIFTNSASDVDAPPQVLTFGLSNAPAGAMMDSTNGVFSWTPSEAQGPGTNQITVIVMDDGVPSLSAAQTFSVVVLETNSPPMLAPINDRVVHAGSAVEFTNAATDADLPANHLTFSLDAGAPPAAGIDAARGRFTWLTGGADLDTTNLIRVRVTDDGVPPMSAAQSFTITVVSRPRLAAAVLSNDVVALTWSAIASRTYRLEYKDRLDDTNWTELLPDVTASGPTATITDSVAGSPQRFYRVKLVP